MLRQKNTDTHNPEWPYIPDYPYKILVIDGSGSAQTNALLNLINGQPDIGNIYLYAKDPFKAKFQLLTKERRKVDLKHCNDLEVFTG